MSEPSRWRRGERYETCVDDGVRGSAPKLCAAYSRARCLPSSPQLRALRRPHPHPLAASLDFAGVPVRTRIFSRQNQAHHLRQLPQQGR